MERKSSILRRIGKFKISVDELEQLVSEIEADGPNRRLKLDAIEVSTKNSTLSYENLEELRHDKTWQKGIEKFSVNFSESRNDARTTTRAIHIHGGDDQENYVWVSGDEEAWVVGTADLVREKMKKYLVWYSKFVQGDLIKFFYYMLSSMILTYIIFFFISQSSIFDSPSLGAFKPFAILVCAPMSIAITLWFVNKIPTRSRLVGGHSEDRNYMIWIKITAIATIIGVIVAIWSLL